MGYLILVVFAVTGLLASMACHVMAWLQVEPPWGKSVFLLHVGIFVVWIPLVIFSKRMMPKPGRNNLEHLLVELPKWVRIATSGLFAYAILNFVYFIYCTSQYPKHKVPFWVELRGFSGHWMLFYGIACAGFVALARRARKIKQTEDAG